jgi:hypothetical protein
MKLRCGVNRRGSASVSAAPGVSNRIGASRMKIVTFALLGADNHEAHEDMPPQTYF